MVFLNPKGVIYIYQTTCLFWLPTVCLALCQLLGSKSPSHDSLVFQSYHVECCHWKWLLKRAQAKQAVWHNKNNHRPGVWKSNKKMCSTIPRWLNLFLTRHICWWWISPPGLRHPDLNMPVWYIVKTFERMGRDHPWEVYALGLPSAQRGCLCLWRSVFKALQWGLCSQHLSQDKPGGTERRTLPSWLSGNLHISFLAPKRIRFNSGPLSRCHRRKTAINNKKSHTHRWNWA